MSEIDDGGSAFPRNASYGDMGMSYRQWLVGQLAPSMLSKIDWHSSWERENFTTDIHHLADAIIAHQRAEQKGPSQ